MNLATFLRLGYTSDEALINNIVNQWGVPIEVHDDDDFESLQISGKLKKGEYLVCVAEPTSDSMGGQRAEVIRNPMRIREWVLDQVEYYHKASFFIISTSSV